MVLSDKQLTELSSLASALTPVSDIAVLMGLDEDALRVELEIPDSPARQAFRKAVAETSLAIRRREIEFAKMGSPLAVQSATSFISIICEDL
jgi:hypothetical protein